MKPPLYLVALCALFTLIVVPAHGSSIPPDYYHWLHQIGADTSTYPYNYTGRLKLARELGLAGHRSEAIKAYTKFLEDYPLDSDALLGRASVFSWMGKYEQSVTDLKKAIQDGSAYSDHWYVLGNVYYYTDRSDDALEAYSRAIELSPDRSSFYVARARVRLSRGDFDGAREDILRAEKNGAKQSTVEKWLERIRRRQHPGLHVYGEEWSVSGGFQYTDVDEGRSSWKQYSASLSREFSVGSLSLNVNRHRRFDEWNHSVILTGYYSDLWQGAYGSLRYLTSPEHDYLPRNDFRGEIYQSLGQGWVGSINYRRLHYTSSEIDLVGGTLGKYHGNWYARLSLLYTRNQIGETGFSQSLTVRNYYAGNADDYVEVSGGIGESTEEFGVDNVQTLDSWSAGAGFVNYFTEQYGVSMSYSHNHYEGEPDRDRYSVSLTHRW